MLNEIIQSGVYKIVFSVHLNASLETECTEKSSLKGESYLYFIIFSNDIEHRMKFKRRW